MKKFSFLAMLSIVSLNSFAQTYHTLQKGQTISAEVGVLDYLNPHCAFESTGINKATIYGVSRGTAFSIDRSSNLHVYKVVDVIDIKIPNAITLDIGATFTYSPIITDAEARTTLTWTSSNSNVATISSEGVVTAVASGQTVITCTASNGVSAFSVITVSPADGVTGIVIPAELNLEVSEQFLFTPIIMGDANATLTWKASNSNVSISPSGSMKASKVGKSVITCTAPNGVAAMCIVNVGPLLTQDIQIAVGPTQMTADNAWLSVGENEVLSPVFTPRNVTNKDVIFMSSNDNIIQVSKSGEITAMSPGYASVYAVTQDGSGKFAKLLVEVTGDTPNKADVNGDGNVTVSDAVEVVNVILGNTKSK